MSDETDELKAFNLAIGPRRVKTKEVEIEAHSLLSIQKAVERQKSKPVTLGQFPRTMVVPKDATCYCNEKQS